MRGEWNDLQPMETKQKTETCEIEAKKQTAKPDLGGVDIMVLNDMSHVGHVDEATALRLLYLGCTRAMWRWVRLGIWEVGWGRE